LFCARHVGVTVYTDSTPDSAVWSFALPAIESGLLSRNVAWLTRSRPACPACGHGSWLGHAASRTCGSLRPGAALGRRAAFCRRAVAVGLPRRCPAACARHPGWVAGRAVLSAAGPARYPGVASPSAGPRRGRGY